MNLSLLQRSMSFCGNETCPRTPRPLIDEENVEWEMERELDDLDRKKQNYKKLHSKLQEYSIAEYIIKGFEKDMNDLQKSRGIRSIDDAQELLKRA